MVNILEVIPQLFSGIDFSSPLSSIDAVASILIVAGFLFYLSRFPVFRVVLGTIFLLVCSVIFYLAGLKLTASLFSLTSYIIIISLPLIFAPEIRHYLGKLGRLSFLKVDSFSKKKKKSHFVKYLIDAVFELAEKKTGATVVIQRRTGLGQTIETGTIIDAKFNSKLLANLFFPKSPLHDGAIVMKDDRIEAAGCLLPIHGDVKLDAPFGTRHRAGLTITRDTDAVVLIVSEQRGEVSLAENGKLIVNIERDKLQDELEKLL